MVKIPDNIVYFFEKQGFVIVTTIDSAGFPHNSCKGMLEIKKDKVYLIDLYQGNTYRNLKNNQMIGITAVQEHQFKGYSLKGRGKIVMENEIPPALLKKWKIKKAGRTTSRIIRNIRAEKKDDAHPEASFPEPNHIVVVEVEEIIDLVVSGNKN